MLSRLLEYYSSVINVTYNQTKLHSINPFTTSIEILL